VLAGNDAAKQGIVTGHIGPQGVAGADDEGDVEEAEGDVVDEAEGDSEGIGEFDGLCEGDFNVSDDGGGWNEDDT